MTIKAEKFVLIPESSMLKLKTMGDVDPIAIMIQNPHNTIFELSYGATIDCDLAHFHNKTNVIIRVWKTEVIYIKVTLHPPVPALSQSEEEMQPIKL